MNKGKIDLDAIASLSGLSIDDGERDSLYSDMQKMILFAEAISSASSLRPCPYSCWRFSHEVALAAETSN